MTDPNHICKFFDGPVSFEVKTYGFRFWVTHCYGCGQDGRRYEYGNEDGYNKFKAESGIR